MYYHVTESNGRFYVDYWWFLRFNHLHLQAGLTCRLQQARESSVCDEHEGDWEGVTVVTPPNDEDHIDYVVYAAHKGTFRYSASQLKFAPGTAGRTSTRPRAVTPPIQNPAPGDCSQPSGLAVDGLVNLPEGASTAKDMDPQL